MTLQIERLDSLLKNADPLIANTLDRALAEKEFVPHEYDDATEADNETGNPVYIEFRRQPNPGNKRSPKR